MAKRTQRAFLRIAPTLLALGVGHAGAAELKLNYLDPRGVDLVLALVKKPDQLGWVDDAVAGPMADDTGQADLPDCKAQAEQSLPCKMSETTRGILATLAYGSDSMAAGLDPLLVSSDLVWDDVAPKSVIVEMAADGKLDHVDFVGLVRGRKEALPAPDASSVFVLRISRDHRLSIVERRSDGEVNVSTLRFSTEK